MMMALHWRILLGVLFLSASTAAFQIPPTGGQQSSRYSTRRHVSNGGVAGIALTRELGKNDKLRHALEQRNLNVQLHELPCIAHAKGSDYERLHETLTSAPCWDYVVVTSPEAARVLGSTWRFDDDATIPPVAAVGKATMKTLQDIGIEVAFCPSKATAATLVDELPAASDGGVCRVLYPASERAQTTLQDGLQARGGFAVTRLNTYDTVTADWTDQDKQLARGSCRIACFASPSSIKGWLQNTKDNNCVLAACIGETSAKACRELGWSDNDIFFPDKPGIDGWVTAVEQAVSRILETVPSSAEAISDFV